MAVTIDIPGFGNVVAQNAAEDATLKEILRALKGKGGGAGGAGAGGAGGPGGISKVLSGLSPKMGEFGENISNTTTLLDNFGKGLSSAGSLLTKGFMGLLSSAGSLGMEFLSGGNRMSDFAQHIPIIGNALGGLTGFIEGNVDTFRDLSDVGASFGNNIVEMNMAASQAGLGLDAFAEMVGNNADKMMLLGGTTTEGAKRFGQLAKDIRNSRQDFMGMGFTMEQLNEHTAEYMEMQARQGRLASMSDAELRKGSEEYLMQIDRLAKVTGKSRKEAEALLKQQNAEANVLALKMRLEGDNLKNFENNLAFVESELPGFAGAIKDMADGVAQTPLAQKLASTIPGFADLQKQMGEGTISQEAYMKQMAAFGPQIESMLSDMDPAAIQALMGKEGFDGLLGGISDYRKMSGKVNNMNFKEIEEEQKKRNKGTSAIANFENAIAGARAKLMEVFVESGLFDMLVDNVGKFTSWFTDKGESGVSKIEEFTTGLINWAKDTVTFLKTEWDAAAEGDGIMDKIMNFVSSVWDKKISPAIGNAFNSLVSNIGSGIWNAIVSNLDTILIGLGAGILVMVTAPIAAPFLAIAAALAAIFGWEMIKSWVGDAWDALSGVFSWIGEKASMLWDLVGPTMQFFSDTLGTLFGWISEKVGALWDFIQPVINFYVETFMTMFGWIGDTFAWIWGKVKTPVMFIYDTFMTMFGWVGDTVSWIYDKIKMLNPFNWFSSDDDEDKAEAKIADAKERETGIKTPVPADSPFNTTVPKREDTELALADKPVPKPSTTTATASTTSNAVASSDGLNNSTALAMIDLLKEQNKLLRAQVNATKGLQGNLLRGVG